MMLRELHGGTYTSVHEECTKTIGHLEFAVQDIGYVGKGSANVLVAVEVWTMSFIPNCWSTQRQSVLLERFGEVDNLPE